MPIESSCPGCNRLLRVADEHAGKQARCPVCNTIYTVGHVATAGAANVASGQTGSPGIEPRPSAASGNEARADVLWHLKTPEGQTYGPVPKTELDRWVQEGRISQDCELRRGEEGWQGAAYVYPVLASSSPASASTPASDNPFSDAAGRSRSAYGAPFAPYAAGQPSMAPHRGVLVLVLGIVSWVAGCPVFGLVAWILGASDLREMRAGRMDPSGTGLTQAGYFLGLIHVLLIAIVLFAIICFMFVRIALS